MLDAEVPQDLSLICLEKKEIFGDLENEIDFKFVSLSLVFVCTLFYFLNGLMCFIFFA
jgi:hypothetical protein